MKSMHWIIALPVVAVFYVFLLGCAAVEREPAATWEVRINAGAEELYIDGEGRAWLADQNLEDGHAWGAVGGSTVDRGDLEIANTTAPGVYRTERYNLGKYVLAVPPGTYTVRLHFAETWDRIAGPGDRVYDITINDRAVLELFDPFETAGALNTAIIKQFRGIEAPDGTISIEFTDRLEDQNGPMINGIEILGH